MVFFPSFITFILSFFPGIPFSLESDVSDSSDDFLFSADFFFVFVDELKLIPLAKMPDAIKMKSIVHPCPSAIIEEVKDEADVGVIAEVQDGEDHILISIEQLKYRRDYYGRSIHETHR